MILRKTFWWFHARIRDICFVFSLATRSFSGTSKLLHFRFTRLVFGLRSSPAILGFVISHHIFWGSIALNTQRYIVDKVEQSLYVDNLVSGGSIVQEAFEAYKSSKWILQWGGFNLWEWNINSNTLREWSRRQSLAIVRNVVPSCDLMICIITTVLLLFLHGAASSWPLTSVILTSRLNPWCWCEAPAKVDLWMISIFELSFPIVIRSTMSRRESTSYTFWLCQLSLQSSRYRPLYFSCKILTIAKNLGLTSEQGWWSYYQYYY